MGSKKSGQKKGATRFPIVGIGASAGGLAALEALFSAMPADHEIGMAFVVVQHLSPHHKSILAELIKRHTRMEVTEVEHGMRVEPDRAYIIPPNHNLAIEGGVLKLLESTADHGVRLPIDFFFRSLAADQGGHAFGIILSGSGSDGALGVRAIKGEGGVVMVQDPDSTEYDSMPRCAIATGLVDYVLAPAEMPERLVAHLRHAFGEGRGGDPVIRDDDLLQRVCARLRARTGHDFSQYKANTLVRRVERRMAIHQVERAADYLALLDTDQLEVEALLGDLLIGVTNFFRDPEAFQVLEEQVIPRLFEGKAAGGEVRVWCVGCSTGEEAYSVAMLIQEQLEVLQKPFRVQVFATDISRGAIAHARGGVFPASIATDVTPARLTRFFVHEADTDTYRVQKTIRDLLVFSEQDVVQDPPFSKLDLICCRNLLIYMNGALQRRLIPLFHYALRPGGVLFLGSSETIGGHEALFSSLDQRSRMYVRQPEVPGATRVGPGELVFTAQAADPRLRSLRQGLRSSAGGRHELRDLTAQGLLQHYAQVGVLINQRGEILHIHGRTGRYLEPTPGDASMNILSMAREGLRRELTSALHRVVNLGEVVRYQGLQVGLNGKRLTVDLVVRPLRDESALAGSPTLYLVIIEEVASPPGAAGEADADDPGAPAVHTEAMLAALERDLRAKEEYLQTTLEELETSNEELRSANEELQSVNEELQSTNEELQTSKEELQSVNEELATVNAELQTKVTDLSRTNNDMKNLLASTGVGTIFVDLDQNISRFTPAVTKAINLIPTDVGRPLAHVVSNLVAYDRLAGDVGDVLQSLVPIERDVRTTDGGWYLLRIQPYRTLDNVVEGAVITFVDTSGRREAELALREVQELAESIVATVREPLVVMDGELQVVMANRSFYRDFGSSSDQTEGRRLYELDDGQWDIPDLRRLLAELIESQTPFEDFAVSHEFGRVGRRDLLLNARLVRRPEGRGELILLAIQDVSGRGITPGGD